MSDYIDQLISTHVAKPTPESTGLGFFDELARKTQAAPPGMTPVPNRSTVVTPAQIKIAERISDIEYALAKQVPSMDAGSTICTIYGGIQLDTDGSARVARAVRAALELELNMLRQGLAR